MENDNHEEYQYLNLIKDIIDNGFWEDGRNGRTKRIVIFTRNTLSLQNYR